MGLSYSFSLKQQVNFYVSVAFIFAFGLFMTTTVVSAISKDAPSLNYLSAPADLSQLN